MARSWIGKGWANQARARKAKRFQKFNDRPVLPVTADDLSRDARRMFRKAKRDV